MEKSFGNTGVGAGVGAGVDAGVDAGVNGGVNGGGVKDGEGHLRQRTTVKGRRRLDHGFSENSRRLSRAVSVSSNISNVSTDLSLSPTFAAAAAPIHVSELQVSGRTVDEIIDSSHTGIIHDAMKKI